MALLYISPQGDGARWRALLAAEMPGIDVRVHPDGGAAGEIEAVLAWQPPPLALEAFPNLKLVQSLGAGIDHLLGPPCRIPPGVALARIVDPAMTGQMAEWCLMAMLNHLRRWQDYRRLQRRRQWRELAVPRPGEVAVAVLGLGEMGGHLARLLVAMGYRVRGWSRTARAIPGATCFHGPARLHDALAGCDVAICLLPLTAETAGVLDARAFAQLKPGALVVNAARGAHVVEEDVIRALDDGQLGAAVLDVQRQEPMAADHPFWFHPRIATFPHIAALTVPATAAAQVAENYRRVKAGLAPRNMVDLARGY